MDQNVWMGDLVMPYYRTDEEDQPVAVANPPPPDTAALQTENYSAAPAIPAPTGIGVIPVPPAVITPPDTSTPEGRYQLARGAAQRVQDIRDRNAMSDMPAGSQSQYLDTGGVPLGAVQPDEFGIPMPPPTGSTGIRGYPQPGQSAATDRYNATTGTQISESIGALPSDTEPPVAPYVPINRSQQYIDEADSHRDRRLALESQRDALTKQLSTIPAGRHGRVNPQAIAITSQIRALNNDINNAHSSESMATKTAAYQSHQDLIENKSNLANREVHGLSNYLDNNPHTPHSPEWEKYLTEGLRKFPNGANTPGGRKIYGDHYGEAPPTSEQMRNAIQFAQQTGQRIVSTQTTKSGRMDFRFKPDSEVPTPIITRYEKLKADLQYHNDQSNTERDANIAAGKANVPYSKSANLNASRTELAGLEQRFPQLNPKSTAPTAPQGNVTQEQYNSLKSGEPYFYNGKQYTKK